MSAAAALASLWQEAGLPGPALDHVTLSGAEPIFPSHFAVGTAAQASIAAAALAAAAFHHARGGPMQEVGVDMRHAAAEFRSERLLRVDGEARDERDAIAGLYRAADGWVRLHTNFPHHRDGILRLLGCAHERRAVADALRGREALAFEAEATAAGLCVAALRSFAEWDAHPQGQAVPTRPLLAIERIGEAPARPRPAADRPLAGVRVIDLTRVIAGPVCGRTLAAHGAEVLRITAPHLPTFERLDIDTGRGKRAARLDLRSEADRRVLRDLVRGADVFIQGYRPGAIAALRLRAGGAGAAAARDRRRLALGLWRGRAVGGAARVRFSGADRERLQRTPRPRRQAKKNRARCRRRRSISQPGTCSRSARSWA